MSPRGARWTHEEFRVQHSTTEVNSDLRNGARRTPLVLFPHEEFRIEHSTTEFNSYLRHGVRGAPLILSPVIKNFAFEIQPGNFISFSERGFDEPPWAYLGS